MICSSALFAQDKNDTIKNPTDYPLDDPRNPNCPCHKLQAKADEEYSILQRNGAVNPQQQNKINPRVKRDTTKIQIQNDDQNMAVDNILTNVALGNANPKNVWILTDNVPNQGFFDNEPDQEERVSKRETGREVGSSGGNRSYKKLGSTKKFVYKVQRKLNRTFAKNKIKHKLAGCGCWTI